MLGSVRYFLVHIWRLTLTASLSQYWNIYIYPWYIPAIFQSWNGGTGMAETYSSSAIPVPPFQDWNMVGMYQGYMYIFQHRDNEAVSVNRPVRPSVVHDTLCRVPLRGTAIGSGRWRRKGGGGTLPRGHQRYGGWLRHELWQVATENPTPQVSGIHRSKQQVFWATVVQ